MQQTGTVDHTPVYPREVIKRALELSATAVVLVHNHPSGDPTPSRADIQMTQTIVDIAKPLGATQSTVAALLVLLLLYLLGWATTRVIGRHLIRHFEEIIARVPLVNTIYRNVKKLLVAVGERPDGRQRVVLIDFPSPEMKAIGIVMRFLRDADTDEELAAVYVPTSPIRRPATLRSYRSRA